MEPRIQYAQTTDGVSIAFYTVGDGTPYVHMPGIPYSHIQLEWKLPEVRPWLDHLSQRRMLVKYDGRGSGLSDRDVADYSLDAHVLDLEAVVDSLNLDSFILHGRYESGPVAIAYSARYPHRVSRLILSAAWARASDFWRSPQVRAVGSAIERDWDVYTETLAQAAFGWAGGEQAREFARFLRESVSPEAARSFYEAIRAVDVADLLPQVRCPTLVIHYSGMSWRPLDTARGLASRIPNARLAVVEGIVSPDLGQAIDDFLGDSEEAATAATTLAREDVHTILFTDMEGSTTLTQRLGDAKAQEVLRMHNRIVRDALKAHSGSEIKHTGDGIMASFASASRALECAIAIQRAFAAHNESGEEPIRVRIGLNAGEPVAEEKDLFGTAVQLAARICAHAEPGEILVPIVVRELAAGKGFLLSDRGDVALRGFEDPVRLFEVRWREEG